MAVRGCGQPVEAYLPSELVVTVYSVVTTLSRLMIHSGSFGEGGRLPISSRRRLVVGLTRRDKNPTTSDPSLPYWVASSYGWL